jgi:hypothetical protein
MEMCSAIGVYLQRGLHFRLREGKSVILVSLRLGAPYADRMEDERSSFESTAGTRGQTAHHLAYAYSPQNCCVEIYPVLFCASPL